MSNKNLTILGVIAGIMLVLAIMQSRIGNKQTRSTEAGAVLIQGLNTADIASITISGGEDSTTLKHLPQEQTGAGIFVVADLDDYPGSLAKINQLIVSCLDIQCTELITSNAENHKDLEVTEEDARTVVKFLDGKDNVITGAVIGKRAEQGSGNYVRLVTGDDVYLSGNVPWLQAKATGYVDNVLFEVDRGEIASVSVTDPNGDYTLISDPNGTIVPQVIPAGKQAKPQDCKQVFEALSRLQFDTVSRQSDQTADIVFTRTYACRMKDSTLYTLNIAKDGENHYLKCTAEFTDKSDVVKERTVESDEQLKEKEAKLLARQGAEEFAAKHAGWVYELKTWQATNITDQLADLVEDIPVPEASEEEAAQP